MKDGTKARVTRRCDFLKWRDGHNFVWLMPGSGTEYPETGDLSQDSFAWGSCLCDQFRRQFAMAMYRYRLNPCLRHDMKVQVPRSSCWVFRIDRVLSPQV